jgi:TM2 domain-containing membrane protein YozV
MNCSNCQKKLRDQAAFCEYCGQVVSEQSPVNPVVPALATPDNDLSKIEGDNDVAVASDQKTLDDAEDSVEGEAEAEVTTERDQVVESAISTEQVSGKSFRTVWLISVFGGWLGIDRFYLGHVGTGVLKLLGGGWYGIWWAVDMIRLLRGRQADKNGVLVEDRDNFRPVAVVISTVLFTLIGLFWLIVILAAMTQGSSD